MILEAIEKHEELNPKLFKDFKLIPEVREKMLEIVNTFIDSLKNDNIKVVVKEVVIVGSSASYNYGPHSDVDLHIRVDTKQLGCPDNLYPLLYGAYRSIFNTKHDIDFYGIPVEIYVEDESSTVRSNGIYSVTKDDWIKVPVKEDIPEIDRNAFDAEFKKWEEEYKKIMNDSGGEDIAESKKYPDLRDYAKIHEKKNKKKHQWGWHESVHVNKDAGNVEYNVAMFNHMNGSGPHPAATIGSSEGAPSAGASESLEDEE